MAPRTAPLLRKQPAVGPSNCLQPPVPDGRRHQLERPGSKGSSSTGALFKRQKQLPEPAAPISAEEQETQQGKAIEYITRVLDRMLVGSAKVKLQAAQELSVFLASSVGAAATAAYSRCELYKLMPLLLGGVEKESVQKDHPLLQAALSCLANLACIGGPLPLLDQKLCSLLLAALRASDAPKNQRVALAAMYNIAQDSECVQMLRKAQAEPVLRVLSRSHVVGLRVPANAALRCFQRVPDSTLQISLKTLRSIEPVSPGDAVGSPEQMRAIHGIARFLGALSPTSAEAAERAEAAAALELCERERLCPLLLQRLALEAESASDEPLPPSLRSDSEAFSPRTVSSSLMPPEPADGAASGFAMPRADELKASLLAGGGRGGRAGAQLLGGLGGSMGGGLGRSQVEPSEMCGRAASVMQQLVVTVVANLSALGGGPAVQKHGGIKLLLESLHDEKTRRPALVGLSNSVRHGPSMREISNHSLALRTLQRYANPESELSTEHMYASKVLAVVHPSAIEALDAKPLPSARGQPAAPNGALQTSADSPADGRRGGGFIRGWRKPRESLPPSLSPPSLSPPPATGSERGEGTSAESAPREVPAGAAAEAEELGTVEGYNAGIFARALTSNSHITATFSDLPTRAAAARQPSPKLTRNAGAVARARAASSRGTLSRSSSSASLPLRTSGGTMGGDAPERRRVGWGSAVPSAPSIAASDASSELGEALLCSAAASECDSVPPSLLSVSSVSECRSTPRTASTALDAEALASALTAVTRDAAPHEAEPWAQPARDEGEQREGSSRERHGNSSGDEGYLASSFASDASSTSSRSSSTEELRKRNLVGLLMAGGMLDERPAASSPSHRKGSFDKERLSPVKRLAAPRPHTTAPSSEGLSAPFGADPLQQPQSARGSRCAPAAEGGSSLSGSFSARKRQSGFGSLLRGRASASVGVL